ncbi:hypothetical protein [Streptomyces sp. NPDC096013]|uniref:hypothetical protein n=1 Tax=Streptomyces sp. NPDC096013 TaxID=3366069 RepID=UPI00381870D4
MPDGDLLGADEEVLGEKPQDTLTLGDFGCLGVVVELGEEAFEVVDKLEVGITVGELGVQRVELAAQAALPGPQAGHPGPQFIEGEV